MEIYADYNKEDRALVESFRSPSSDESMFKGIPISLYREITRLLPMKNRRIKFRGSSKLGYTRPQSHTIKVMADTFAVYYDNDVIFHTGRPGE
jgi:hypothetical protein|tara:strand:- start:2097 stop:2375 length:279 start_codon:yes stop_codon:yes gene_type:complete